MPESIMEQAIRAAKAALRKGSPTVCICGLLFPLVHQHHNEYSLMSPVGEVFRLVKERSSIRIFPAKAVKPPQKQPGCR